jgi:putative ABC transport system substrate-binding protein
LPGRAGNITGLSSLNTELVGKRVELLKETFPSASRIGFLWNPNNAAVVTEWMQVGVAARSLHLDFQSLELRREEDLTPAFEEAGRRRIAVLVVALEALTQNLRATIVALATKNQLPTIYSSREFVDEGGLMSYGVSYPDLYHRAATYVDKILKGAKPGDLPVEEPAKFDTPPSL